MLPRVTQVHYTGEYRLTLTFTNGVKGELDFRSRIVGRGGVFQPLENIEFFKQVQVDPEAGTLIWPNDVDLDPDVLYSEVIKAPVLVAEIA